MIRSAALLRTRALTLALALVALPFAVGAKEESKMQIRLTDVSEPPVVTRANATDADETVVASGNGPDKGAVRASVKTHLQGSRVVLKLLARGLEADTDYVLLCKQTEDAADSAELASFTTKSNGSANVTQDLSKTDDPDAPADPRGKFLVIAHAADASMEVVGGWLYGDAADDGPMTKIKELTELEPDPGSAPSGRVAARYDMQPNGRGRLSISMRGVPAGDYEVLVDGVLAATLTPSPGGQATADFRTHPSRGSGSGKAKAHRKRSRLDFDPRRKEILVQLADATPMFRGPMLAQIDGLNTCSASPTESPLSGGTGSGTAALGAEENCETVFEVGIVDVPAGSYDLYVDGAHVATFDAADDGFGTVTGSVRFDPTPDAGEDEVVLDFPVASGSFVEIFDAGADPDTDPVVLSGTLL